MIQRHEGYRDRIYRCPAGVLTVGWGHAFQEGDTVPPEIIEKFFWYDLKRAMDGYNSLRFDLDTVRRAVVVDMIFNLGLSGFKKFHRTIEHIRNQEWERAAAAMMASKWARQVGKRAEELAEMMRNGEYKVP